MLSTLKRRSTGKKAVQLFPTSNHSAATCYVSPAVPSTLSSNTSTLSIQAKCPFHSFGTTFTATSPKPHPTSHYTPPMMTWSAFSTPSPSTDSSMQSTPLFSPLATTAIHTHLNGGCPGHRQSVPPLPHWQTPSKTPYPTHHPDFRHHHHCGFCPRHMHFPGLQQHLQTNPRGRDWIPALSSPMQCCHHPH